MDNENLKNMKLIHYSGVGLKIIAEYIERKANKSINIEVELASDRVDLRKMINEVMDKKEGNKDERDDNESQRWFDKVEIPKIEIERINDEGRNQSKTSAQMILELCHNVGDQFQS